MLQRICKLAKSMTFLIARNGPLLLQETLRSAIELPVSPDSPAIPTHKAPTFTSSGKVSHPDGMDELCEALKLKKRHPSVESVVEALNACVSVPSNVLVCRALKRFSNDWVLALGVFTWAKRQTGYVLTSESYDLMVDVLGKCKEFDRMWGLVDEMVGLGGHVSLATMSKVMRRLCKAGKYEEAVAVFGRIENFGVEKDVEALNVLMFALVERGETDRARNVFLEFKGSGDPNLSTFNILVNGYCKARRLHHARMVMDEMEEQGFRPDVVCYTCLVDAYCKMKDFEGVEAILAEMQEMGWKPNMVTYTTIMHSLVKDKKVDVALEFCERMKRDCGPDASLSSAMIIFLYSCGRHDDAWEAFQEMRKQGVRRDWLSYSYNYMISSFCERMQEENALKLLHAMEEDAVRPNVQIYTPLLKMYCKLKRMKMVEYLLDHMSKNDVSIDPVIYSLLVHELCLAGKLKYAAFFFSEMVSKGMVPRESIYDKLHSGLERANLVELKGKIERLMLRAKERTRV